MKSSLTFSLLLPAWLLFSQTTSDLIPRDLFFKEKDRTHIKLSKSGEFVFFKKTGEGAANTVFFFSVQSPLIERKKEFAGEVTDLTLTYDDGIFAIVKSENGLVAQFATIHSTKIKSSDLVPFDKLTVLHLSRRFPNKILLDVTAKDASQSGIYLLDLLSGTPKRLGKMDGFEQMFFDQNFAKTAALGLNDQGGNTIYRIQDGAWQPVFEYPFHPEMFIGGLSKIISVATDGATIYATDNFQKDKTSLVAINTATGATTELASDPDADVLPFGASLDASGKPTSVAVLWGDTRRHFLDEKTKADFEFLEKEIGNTGFVEASQDDAVWLVRSLDGGPPIYYVLDRKGKKLTKLFSDYSHLDGFDLAGRKAHTVITRDGLKLPVHLYVPSGMAKADGLPKVALPTVVYVHGGPWAGVTHWNSWFHTRNFQLLADRGYAVINMEFRGTTGLGKAVCDAGDLQWGANMHNDIVDVVTWATKSGIANPRRVALWGWSYGGYAVNFALGAAPDLFSCGISMYGIGDLHAFTKLPFANGPTWRSRVGDPNTEEGAALLQQHSPMAHLQKISKPMLLTTGSLDDRVPQSQVDDFANALNEAKKNVTYFYYPDEGHDYQKPESWASFWAIAEEFLQRYAGGRKLPKGTDLDRANLKVVHGNALVEGLE